MKRNEVLFQLKKEQEKNTEVYCSECKTTKRKRDFYIRLISDTEKIKDEDSEDIELPVGICKDCFMNKYFKYLDDNNGDTKKSIYKLCKQYNLPYDSRLIDSLCESTESCSGVLKTYIRHIHSLNQYKVSFDDYVMNNSNDTISEFGVNTSVEIKEKSNIDFIEEDIKQIKINIQKSSESNDVNAHGKWLNSFRDALALREDLRRFENKNVSK
jgi:hypothetical protein